MSDDKHTEGVRQLSPGFSLGRVVFHAKPCRGAWRIPRLPQISRSRNADDDILRPYSSCRGGSKMIIPICHLRCVSPGTPAVLRRAFRPELMIHKSTAPPLRDA